MSKYAFLFIDEGEDDLVHTQGHDRQTSHAGPTPEQQAIYAEIFRWFDTNRPTIVHGGAELQPTRTATTIRKNAGKVTVLDGPFLEAKESVGGLTIFELPDAAAAVALAKTWPGYGVEIRPIVEER